VNKIAFKEQFRSLLFGLGCGELRKKAVDNRIAVVFLLGNLPLSQLKKVGNSDNIYYILD
jgi:hypothetical protein